MINRLLIYPLLLLGLLQLITIARQGARWHAGPLVQLSLVLATAALALVFSGETGWVIGAWSLFGLSVVMPRVCGNRAWHWLAAREYGRSARAWRWSSWFVFGRPGRVLQAYAAALTQWANGDHMAGEHTVRALLSQPLPATVRGQVNLWLLTMLVVGREWATAIEFYEQSGDWGTLATATQARLLVARAYAEAGNFERALRCLDFVALSPRTLGGLDRQFWSARVAIAALAGDADELERLLGEESHRPRRGFERFAATWRGRCALARGATVEAQRLLTRALALTPPAAQAWRAALGEYLAAAANATSLPAPVPAAANPGYRRGQGMLANAVATAAPWRRLMDVEAPRGFTRALLLVLALAHVGHAVMLWWPPHVPLWHWLGNIPGAVRAGEWWRLVTALFLHAEWWHLAMNAAGLWVFGAGVERALGRWRMLAVFVVGGTLGNALSMWRGEYGVSFGASGSVFALLGAFWVALYRLNVPLYLRYRRQLLFLLTAMVLIDLTLGAMETQVDDLAHAGGFAAGLLVSLALTRGQKHRHALPTAL